jgi:hypothetical protein
VQEGDGAEPRAGGGLRQYLESCFAGDLTVPGWTIFGKSLDVAIQACTTTYGDTSLPTGFAG